MFVLTGGGGLRAGWGVCWRVRGTPGRVQPSVGRRRLRAVVFEHHERLQHAVADPESPPPPSPLRLLLQGSSHPSFASSSFILAVVVVVGESTSATRRMARASYAAVAVRPATSAPHQLHRRTPLPPLVSSAAPLFRPAFLPVPLDDDDDDDDDDDEDDEDEDDEDDEEDAEDEEAPLVVRAEKCRALLHGVSVNASTAPPSSGGRGLAQASLPTGVRRRRRRRRCLPRRRRREHHREEKEDAEDEEDENEDEVEPVSADAGSTPAQAAGRILPRALT